MTASPRAADRSDPRRFRLDTKGSRKPRRRYDTEAEHDQLPGTLDQIEPLATA